VAQPTLRSQAIAGLEDPPDDGQAHDEKQDGDRDADADVHVGKLEEAPAEAADQVNERVEQRDRPPERRQQARRIERAAEERERGDDEHRHDLQSLETVGPDAENEAEQAEADRGQH